MREKLIRQILKTGKQIPETKLNELKVESLEMILILRKEFAK